MWEMLESDPISNLSDWNFTVQLYLCCLSRSSPAHTFPCSSPTSTLTHTRSGRKLSIKQERKLMLKLNVLEQKSLQRPKAEATMWGCLQAPFEALISSKVCRPNTNKYMASGLQVGVLHKTCTYYKTALTYTVFINVNDGILTKMNSRLKK